MGEEPRSSPSRWWALFGVVPFIPFFAAGAVLPGDDQTRLYFAGTPARWLGVVNAIDAGDATIRTALLLDLAFAVSIALVGFALLRTGWRYWAPDRRRLFGPWRFLPWAALAAGVLDVIETAGQLIWFQSASPPTIATHAISAIAWWKFVAYAAALVGMFGLVLGPLCAPVIRPILRWVFAPVDRRLRHGAPPDSAHPVADNRDSLGICASGGGIRSASVMLGAFRGLSDDGTFARARWLHAVSGGGYTAGGWRVSSLAREDTELFDNDHAWFQSVRHRRRFLDNGWGSLVGGVLGAAARTIFVFGGVLASAVLVGWLAGWLTRSWAVQPTFSNLEGGGATTWSELTDWRLLLPGLLPLAAAVALAIVARLRADEKFRSDLDRFAIVLAVVGVVLLTVLVVVPIGIRYGRPALQALVGTSAEANAGWLALLSAVGVVAAVRQLLTSELKKRWSRLGGVALAVGLLLLAGKVADDQANLDRFFHPAWIPLVAALWMLLLELPPSHRLTLNGVYRKRLAETFCLGPSDQVPVAALEYDEEPAWAAYLHADGPELVLCGTSHSTARQLGGVRGHGFTFRPGGVTLHDGASARWIDYPSGSWWDGYPRGWIVSRSMALTGAAFASAMGRQSFGSTNSLLAAVNLRLGMWVPNPRFAEWFVDRDTSPRVHLGYFAKELLSRYHPDRDAFVYVADGGHRDNLGLVEQLREQPAKSIVLDASGDRPGTFKTLKEAIELAGTELGVEVDVDFSRIEPRVDDEPLDCVTTGTITYADGTEGQLVYAKAQISDEAPVDLRQFAAANPPFPDYSTGDLFLNKDEFDALVALGNHLATRLATLP